MEEIQLFTEAASGKKDSLRLLLERYYKVASAVAFAVCGKAEWAREAASYGLAAVGASLAAVENPTQFGKYLIEVVKSESHRFLQGKRRPFVTVDNAKRRLVNALQEAKRVEDIPLQKFNELILDALSALSEQSREVLVLFCYYNNSFVELGRILGAPSAVVKEQFERASADFGSILSPLYSSASSIAEAKVGEEEVKLLTRALKDLRLEEGISGRIGELLAQAYSNAARKSPVRLGIYAVSVLGIVLLILLIFYGVRGEPDVPVDGFVERVVDGAKIRYFGASNWLPCRKNSRVVLGSSVKTDEGKCSLFLNGKVRVILAPKTVCDFSQFKELQKIILDEGEIFVQSVGYVQVDVGESKVFGKDCEFDVKFEISGEVSVIVVKGEAAFFNNNGSVAIGPGKSGRLRPGGHIEEVKDFSVEQNISWAQQLLP